MKHRLLVTLGVSAALLAGLATMASAEPRDPSFRRVEPTGGISIQLNLPIFGRAGHQARPGEHDSRCQTQQRNDRGREMQWGRDSQREREMQRERDTQRGRDSWHGRDHYNGRDQSNGRDQHDHGYRGN